MEEEANSKLRQRWWQNPSPSCSEAFVLFAALFVCLIVASEAASSSRYHDQVRMVRIDMDGQ